MFNFRTDMALESQRRHGSDLEGVTLTKNELNGVASEKVVISSRESAELLGKPEGIYVTLDVSSLSDPQKSNLENCAKAIAKTVSELLPPFDSDEPILAVGLGNRSITSDSFGPDCADRIIATRHLSAQAPKSFSSLRPVAVLSPGVLGSTGIESGETVSALVSALRPSVCVLIDALASFDHGGLCKSVQISNTGIAPGSGVANHRLEISRKTLGVPCISIGVPTVVEAKTLVSAVAQKHGIREDLFSFDLEENSFFLTPKDIDKLSLLCAGAVATGLNLAFQPNLTIEDIEALLS